MGEIRFVIVGMLLGILLLLGLIFWADESDARANCSRACVEHVKARELHEARHRRTVRWHRVADPYWGTFNAIASCESHGNWHIEGYFSGGIQFTDRSWHAVGGTGRAGQHSKLEQIYRGVLLMHIQGWRAWPVCRHAAGV